MHSHFVFSIIAASALTAGSPHVLAQTSATGAGPALSTNSSPAYPAKPVRIVTAPPGGANDLTARLIAQGIARPLGQQVIVDNRPTAVNGQIVYQAPADGYTLLLAASSFTIGSLMQETPYDVVRDFAPITLAASSPGVIVVHPSVPVKRINELIALAKTQPDTLHYASSGNGSSQHLMGGLFESLAGVKMQHVPYRGSSGAATDLIAGVVETSFAGVPNALAQVPQGRLRALAVTTARRIPQLPDVPTMQEAGVPGYEASVWLALLAPANTPREIVNRLNSEISKLMAQADTQKALFDACVMVAPSTPETLQTYMASEIDRWGKVVKSAGVQME